MCTFMSQSFQGRLFLWFGFEGWVYQYKILPLGSPCLLTKATETVLAPLREVSVCILNYLDDRLTLAHS